VNQEKGRDAIYCVFTELIITLFGKMNDKRRVLNEVEGQAIIWDFSGTLADTKQKKLFEGAEEILEKASQKYKQALVTATLTNPDERIQLLKDLGVYKYFSIVEISLKKKKLFLEICEKFECRPEDVYVIGDGYSFGIYPKEIMTGNQLGMKTIWCNFKNTSKLKQMFLGIKYWKKIEKLSDLESILFH
jgi:FMN phosphatase YigB (HAD superfamily)